MSSEIIQEERSKTTERLIYDDFRAFYGRPFYTWSDNTNLKKVKKMYEYTLSFLIKQPSSREIDYRKEVCRELLKDLKDV